MSEVNWLVRDRCEEPIVKLEERCDRVASKIKGE